MRPRRSWWAAVSTSRLPLPAVCQARPCRAHPRADHQADHPDPPVEHRETLAPICPAAARDPAAAAPDCRLGAPPAERVCRPRCRAQAVRPEVRRAPAARLLADNPATRAKAAPAHKPAGHRTGKPEPAPRAANLAARAVKQARAPSPAPVAPQGAARRAVRRSLRLACHRAHHPRPLPVCRIRAPVRPAGGARARKATPQQAADRMIPHSPAPDAHRPMKAFLPARAAVRRASTRVAPVRQCPEARAQRKAQPGARLLRRRARVVSPVSRARAARTPQEAERKVQVRKRLVCPAQRPEQVKAPAAFRAMRAPAARPGAALMAAVLGTAQ